MSTLQTPGHSLPQAPLSHDMDVHELINITMQLRDLLTREAEHLKKMEVRELAALQDDKVKLTALLENYQRIIAARPELLQSLDADMREDLADLIDNFTRTVNENFQRMAVARAVNQRVVQAIMEVITEQHHPGTYNKAGSATAPNNLSLSFNLNQKA